MTTNQGQFQVGRIKLQIRSQHFFTNYINNVTPAEILMLRQTHGPDAVTLHEITGYAINTKMNERGQWLKRSLKEHELREKLEMKYKKPEVEKVFPGATTKLPYTFEEIGVKVVKDIQEEQVSEDEEGWEPMSGAEVQEQNLPRNSEVKEIEPKKDEPEAENLLGDVPEEDEDPEASKPKRKTAKS